CILILFPDTTLFRSDGVDHGQSRGLPSMLDCGRRSKNTIRVVSPDTPSASSNPRPLSVQNRANVLPTLPEYSTDFLSGTLFEDSNFEEIGTPTPPPRQSSRNFAARNDPKDADDETDFDKSPRSSEARSSG